MNADPSFALDTWAMIAALLFGGGGMSVSLPPNAPDATLDRMAPAEPLVFINVSGQAAASAQSENRTERLFAEPELRDAFRQTQQVARSLALRNSGNTGDQIAARMAPAFFRMWLTQPWMLYATTMDLSGPRYDLRGAFVASLGEVEPELARALSFVPPDVAKKVEIAGHSFRQIQVHPKAPPVTYGIHDHRFYMVIGAEELETILARIDRPAPQWLTNLRKRFDVPRVSSLLHIETAKLMARRSKETTMEAGILRAMGLRNLKSLSVVTGLDEQAAVQFTSLNTTGPLEGLLAAATSQPLTAADLKGIPRDSLVALATRIDPAQAFAAVVSTLSADAQRDIQATELRIRDDLGMSLEELLAAFGDTWTLHTAAADGGLITGWTVTGTLRNRQRVETWLTNVRRALQQDSSVKFRRGEFLDQPYDTIAVADPRMPFAPTVALTKDRIVIGLYPQAVRSFLSRQKREEPSLAELPQVAAALDQKAVTISVADNKHLLQLAYPIMQMGVRMGLGQLRREGAFVDDALMPSATSVVRHFGIGITHSRRSDSGVVIEQRQTLPTGGFSAMTPMTMGLIFPAVERARAQARAITSINNLRQIAIGMHNYHDTFASFPPRYRTDADGKPLLSWRVHLLPFVEGANLYEQFHLDEPWDSPHNKQLIAKMPTYYRSPASQAAPGKTTYLAVDAKDSTIMPPAESQFGERFQKGTRMADIRDGTSNSALIVEVNDDHAVVWTKPEDYKPPADDPGKGLRGLPNNQIHIGMADGSVQRLSPATATKNFLRAIFTKSGGEPFEIRR